MIGFGASAWKAAARDRFIGWSVAQREARLHLVVNNARFLILPWVQVRNLASLVLAHSSRRLPDDWQARYGYRPVLLETFVQSDRFAGTSYRAANWRHVGQTQGRGQAGRAPDPRAAQEGHLAPPAQTRFPPPTVRSALSASPPVERTLTNISYCL